MKNEALEQLKNEMMDSIPKVKHKLFLDNLFYIYKKPETHNSMVRDKISIEDLDRPNLMCIIDGHIPHWKNLEQKRLDFELLKELRIIL